MSTHQHDLTISAGKKRSLDPPVTLRNYDWSKVEAIVLSG